MHRIDTPGATADDLFQSGNPIAVPPIEATIVGPKWLNAVQEELANFIEAQSITLDDADDEQLTEALESWFESKAYREHTTTAPWTVLTGEAFHIGSLVLVAIAGASIGNPVAGYLLGEHAFTKHTLDVVVEGSAMYWDTVAHLITGTITGNTILCGTFLESAGNGITSVQGRLSGISTT